MGLRIGITVVGRQSHAGPDWDAALWSSGITQNIVFLAMLLRRLPDVGRVTLVACPDIADAQHPLAQRFGLDCIPESACADQLDLVIELGARGGSAAMTAFRNAGGKLVSYVAGNVMAMNFEQLACSVPHGEILSEVAFDAVWVLPHHWRMNASYAKSTRSPHVFQAPLIWAPDVLVQAAARARVDLFWKRPQRKSGARIGVFDPNVNVLKTFHVPLLVCEAAERARPGAIDRVLLFSAAHLKGVPHVEEFIAATDLGRSGRVFVEHRAPLPEVLGVHVDMVVTHQWENSLNYLYWDTLYTGHPLVHNSASIEHAGYYYQDFNPHSGGEALLAAIDAHAANRDQQRPLEIAAVWGCHIDNPTVQRAYNDLVRHVMGQS